MRATASPASIPAPVGGWNTRDALDAMPETDAVLLDNWFPDIGKVRVRPGYTEHSSGMGSGNVDTLAEYHSGTTRKLIACANGNIYDATTATASSLASGFSENAWQTQNFKGKIFFVNGTDAPQDYDGSTVSATAWSGTGLTITDLIDVKVFKSRLYFIEKDTQSFWYASPSAITGALAEFDMSVTNQFGGTLLTMAVWTFDGGQGIDDYAVFIMTSGEVIIYQGSDPGSPTDWGLVGYYHIGVPLSRRGVIELGGDVLITTTSDYVKLSEVLQNNQVGVSSKLSGAIIEASANSSLFGWQTIIHRKGSMIVSNVPTASGTYDQHVVNSTTGAPCRFRGIVSRCWGVYDDDLYFGSTNGKVYKVAGSNDDGDNISAECRQAWTDFNSPNRKRLTAVRPVLGSNGTVSYGFSVGFDFNEKFAPSPTSTPSSASVWDSSPWDTTPWGGFSVDSGWRVSGGTGQNLAPTIKVESQNTVYWYRTDFRMERGRNL